jgi:hypothetical protein
MIGFGLWFGLMRTEPGRRLRSRLGRSMARAASGEEPEPRGTSSSDDHRFLLEHCNGNEAELLRRLEVETRRNPGLSDDEVYRKAIRTWFLENRGGTHGSIAEELDDTWL